MTVSQQIARFVSEVRDEDVPATVREAGALHALDALGCGLAAHALGESGYAAAVAREEYGALAATGASVIGVGALPAPGAAFVNGTLCHTLDHDDTHPDSVVHVSAATASAALAAGQLTGASGREALTALVLGNEVSIRLGMAAGGAFHARGFHPTGVCGVFGAATVAARTRGLSATQGTDALGIAGSMASGLLEFLADGSTTKRLHPGWAARAGLTAAALAAYGATGPDTVLEGARGFFATYLHGVDHDAAGQVADLGERWETPAIAYKPYAACHYTHAPVDALLSLVREHGIGPDDIARITAFSDETGVGLVLAPAEDKVAPRTPYDAKFSLPYCLGSVLVRGHLDASSFEADEITDERVLSIAKRVDHELRQYSPTPDAFGGGVRVETTDGRVLEAELRHQRGGAENPFSREDVLEKFRSNARLALSEDDVATLELGFLTLDDQPDLGFLRVIEHAQDQRAISM